MRVVFSPLAASDLRDAWAFVAQESTPAANRLLAEFTEILGMLADRRFQGPTTTLTDGRRVKSWPVPPYRIYYRILGEEMQVVRLYHQARKPIERQRRHRR